MAQSMPARPSSHTQAKAPLPNSTHVPPLAHSFSPYVGQRMEASAARAIIVVIALLLLFNTTRAHSPDPQARGPLSLWTEV